MTGSETKGAYNVPVYAKEFGQLNRDGSHGRCSAIKTIYSSSDSDRGLLLCATNKFVQVYRLFDEDEIKHRTKKRLKRIAAKQKAKIAKLREALSAAGREIPDDFESPEVELKYLENLLKGFTAESDMQEEQKDDLAPTDECLFMFSVNVHTKIKSFETSNHLMVIGHANNTFSVYKIPVLMLTVSKGDLEDKNLEELLSSVECIYSLDMIGHQTPINSLHVSHDDSMVLSVSNETLKLWNSQTHHCVKTIHVDNVTCCFFLAGNRHLMIGTKVGVLKIVHLDSCVSDNIYTEKGVEAVAVSEHPKHSSFAVAFRDGDVILFELGKKGGKITAKPKQCIQVSDEPVDIAYSPDGRILAVALRDSTIQTLHADSLKLFLTLYGHKLPITCLSITTDGTLLATASLDKTVKVWGLDFGNIHKSILAHASTVAKCRWMHDTHYLITCGLDFLVKIWDCDSYELITQLRGHVRPVKSLAVSDDSYFFVTAGEDYSIRFWKRTDEQLFLSEERERDMEIQLEHEATRDDINHAIPVDKDSIQMKASVKTIQSVKQTEQLIQIIDEAYEYKKSIELHAQELQEIKNSGSNEPLPKAPEPPLELFNRSPLEHIMHAIGTLNNSIVNEVLIALPFLYAERLLSFIADGLEKYLEARHAGNENFSPMEMPCKVALVLVQIYFRQFVSNMQMRPLVARLKLLVPTVLKLERVGFLHATSHNFRIVYYKIRERWNF
ncbi:bifunctional WD40 repeat/WD40-YVTN repeat-like-containing domain superfamily/WD40-repeat-containing domain superfamily [Babesia duncani]|uniref:Bifunctional WD40 repeat/WD40-YVTN repeat-like-containing domain superfamily/WD40-repeat-containing domain superfamily n=1 Tax=Babesia duncani TaxID=323732 RepID=A0AAD9PIV6_9APIC|nr:bifunctional WD40 repeat/WD40-YVTN repeat-like-containing domain superfamily/WD40-repeat-containing domain superfamily [Babesia duncani]